MTIFTPEKKLFYHKFHLLVRKSMQEMLAPGGGVLLYMS